MDNELKNLIKSGSGYIKAKTVESWLTTWITIAVLGLTGLLFLSLTKFIGVI